MDFIFTYLIVLLLSVAFLSVLALPRGGNAGARRLHSRNFGQNIFLRGSNNDEHTTMTGDAMIQAAMTMKPMMTPPPTTPPAPPPPTTSPTSPPTAAPIFPTEPPTQNPTTSNPTLPTTSPTPLSTESPTVSPTSTPTSPPTTAPTDVPTVPPIGPPVCKECNDGTACMGDSDCPGSGTCVEGRDAGKPCTSDGQCRNQKGSKGTCVFSFGTCSVVDCPVPPADCIVNCTFTPTQCESSQPCECDISPSDLCDDDSVTIQNALNTLDNLPGAVNNTLRLNGDFVFCTTIYIPPNINWVLNGSMTLCDNADLDEIGYVNVSEGIDATRLTAITETVGATNISMSGGYYDGNKANQGETGIRLINFVAVTYSTFRDMTIDNALDDGFTLGPLSTSNECNGLIGMRAGGNGLTDKGSHNTWHNCIAEDCASDGWTIKCRHSSFHACIGRNNEGPGFGAYARIDGSNDKGETINWNSFYAIEAYGNARGGFSANIASNVGSGAMFCDNYIQGAFYDNAMDGLTFRNKQSDGLIQNNQVDVVVYNNMGLLNSGDPGNEKGGLAMDINTGSTVDNTTGIVVAHGNGVDAVGYDVNVNKATTTSLTIYADSAQASPKLKCQDGSNNCPTELSVVNFACPPLPSSSYSQMKYCDLTTPAS